MVALIGTGWRLAPCLVAMYEEANRLAPKRNRKADGSIGDTAHASRTSDHNPANGWVTALDLTHAPESGFDAHARARLVVARHDRRLKYAISNGQIARSYDKPGIRAWTWAPYTGSNPHRFHAHFSVHNTAEARDDLSPWWPSTPHPELTQEDDIMAADPRGTARLVMREFLGRSPSSYTELDFHAGQITKLGLNGYIEWLEQQQEAQLWAAKIGAEVRAPDPAT